MFMFLGFRTQHIKFWPLATDQETPGHPVGRPPPTRAVTGKICLCLCAFSFPDRKPLKSRVWVLWPRLTACSPSKHLGALSIPALQREVAWAEERLLGDRRWQSVPKNGCVHTLRAKGTPISEPRFSTPCEMRFFPTKMAFVEGLSLKRPFSLSRVGKIASRRGRKSGAH